MRKKIIFPLVLFLILSMIYVSSSLLGLTGSSQVIVMKEEGFSPSKFTIKQNTRVIFKNLGSKPHWPASDFHPTHGIYPEFDSAEEIANGKEWTFKFEKIGKWRFHDHLFPENKGIIIVEK